MIAFRTSKRRVRYDGSSCLNVRSITTACEGLSGKGRGQPISRKELASLLWFIEICVTSNRLYFDGTLPNDEVTAALQVVDDFVRRHSLADLRILPISFKEDSEILRHAAAAIAESSLTIGDLSLERDLDRDVRPEEHERFFDVVVHDANLSEEERQARGLELVEQRFRGSKCLAGLMGAGAAGMIEVRKLYDRFPGKGRLVTGALINRFRLNYLNQLASQKRGAYVPDPTFEPITQQHVRLFQDFLAKQLAREGVRAGAELLAESLREETPLPPIGLYALMLTKERGHPIAVLITALEMFKHHRALRKLVWGHTGVGLELQNRTTHLADYREEVEEYFIAAYRRLRREAADLKPAAGLADRIKKYTVPALLATLAGLVPAPTVAVGAAALTFKILVGTAGAASARALGDALLGVGVNSYISEYKTLRLNLTDDPALAQPVARISDQVERVFGRPLV